MNVRRFLIGEPLPSNQAIHQRLSKLKALAVFSSDALSSTAYATEAILLVLIAAGTGALGVSMGISIGIVALLIIVAFSYYQTIHAYPNGGGAYIVANENLGKGAGLIAAASLLIDYTLTVAVSVSAGVAALASAFPAIEPIRVDIALAIVVFITVMNLRGVKDSGTFFAIPTYMFVVGVFIMIGMGIIRVLTGDIPATDPSALAAMENAEHAVSGLTLFLVLRAFAGGCTALTGVEAISNGIPAFKKPESENAGKTLIAMVTMLSVMFLGITFLANSFPIVVSHDPSNPTVLSQIARGVFGEGSLLFFYMQFATLFILSLAANTAYADFPRLASLISNDRYLPRQLTNLGDRLVFSNGIIFLAVAASVLIIIFNAHEHNLLPLYAVGVFLSFTLSQSGMVIHWLKERHHPNFVMTRSWQFHVGINGFGAVCTFIVLCILLVTKFVEGAWLVAVMIPFFVGVFLFINRHYKQVAQSLTLDGIQPFKLSVDNYPSNNDVPVVVLLNSLNRASLQSLEFAIRFSNNVRVCAIETDPHQTDALVDRWVQWDVEIPLDIIPSQYREIGHPLIKYLHQRDLENEDDVPTVVIMPEFVVERWYEKFLHNQTTVAIRAALYQDQIEFGRGRAVITVPYRIGDVLYEPMLNGDENDIQPSQAGQRVTNLPQGNAISKARHTQQTVVFKAVEPQILPPVSPETPPEEEA